MYLHYKGQKTGKAKEVAQTLNNIETERVRNRMTKEKLTEKLGISLKTYYNWLKEATDIPSRKLLEMARLFNVSMEYLLYNGEVNGDDNRR